MSSVIDIPCTQRRGSALAQRTHLPHAATTAPPINESMVRQRLAVNLPHSFRQRNAPYPSSRDDTTLREPHCDPVKKPIHPAAAHAEHRPNKISDSSARRSRPPHAPRRRASSTATTSSSSSRSSSSASSGASDRSAAEREDYAFYARLVRLGRGGSACGEAAVAQCCDTVRGTLRALEQAQVHTQCADSDAGFFWLDLHGVPPPLPGSSAWQQQPRRWRRRQRARDDGGSDAPLSALWAALGLRAAAAGTLATACEQRQARPRPDRASLDDVYEEELVDLSCPDDRVLHVEPLQQQQQPREEREAGAAAAGAAAAGSTHYVVLELATLLAPVRAAAAAASEAAWEGALLSRATSATHANEPLNDVIWTDDFERGMNRYGATGAANGRQVAHSSLYSAEVTATPLIASTYVVCFPTGCVTWCPASTLGLASADRRAQRTRLSGVGVDQQQDAYGVVLAEGDEVEGIPDCHWRRCSDEGGADAEDTELQCVRSWERLQTSVFSRLRWTAKQGGLDAPHPAVSPQRPSSEFSVVSAAPVTGEAAAMCTSEFLSMLLCSVFYAYLPNTAVVLSAVDAIDSMMPLIKINKESDQADVLRRVLLLRRRLALQRRLLFQKIRLLEALDRPTMHTVARFVRSTVVPSWAVRAATLGGVAQHFQRGVWPSAGGANGLRSASRQTEVPWSSAASERVDGGRRSNSNPVSLHLHDAPSPSHVATAALSDHSPQRQSRPLRVQPPPSSPPSLTALHKSIMGVLRNLEAARTVLGNTTLIYTSKVNFNNSRTSETADYFALMCQYVLLVVLPLNIVASHWAMNCPVPFMAVEGTTPFWCIVGVMAFIGVAGISMPIYAYKTRRIHLIA